MTEGLTTAHRRTRLIMRKWGERPHWEFDSLALGSDASGHWFGTPVGTLFSRPGRRYLTEAEHVVLVPRPGLLDGTGAHGRADWVATFYAAGSPVHTYVDITTPTVVTDAVVTTTDLDLDVVRDRDGPVWVDDEDEFDEHRRLLGYPDQVVRDAVAVCERVRRAVDEGEAPFDGAARRWLRQLSQRPGAAQS